MSESREQSSHVEETLPGGLKTARVEALSDGVFAIAMTLLILDIAVPNVKSVSPAQLPGALRALGPEFLIYALSFIILGIYWVGHHNQYHYIGRSDRVFLWINILFLMFVAAVPFSTALLGRYPLERPALFVYGMNLIAASLHRIIHMCQTPVITQTLKGPSPKAKAHTLRRTV